MDRQLVKLAGYFPVVTVLGPRQSGKTTLVKSVFPDHTYLNMEDADTRTLALQDYKAFFKTYPGPLVLDEIQRVPEILSAIQVLVDEKREVGKYILTGSHQPLLREGITQLLAGRTAVLQLLPLSLAELSDSGITLDRDDYLVRGFLPASYAHGIPPADLYRSYYATYVERDVRQIINMDKQGAFELFLKLLAGRVGQLVNLNSMAGETGVSQPTLASWLSVLEASFIIFRLQPYFPNFGKRQLKTPKLYFSEPGLASWLLGIVTPDQAARDPLFGGLFENMVVVEALKARLNAGEIPELYYYRSRDGLEVDLILNMARHILPIEIKASRTFSTELARNLQTFQKHTDAVSSSALVYAGDVESSVNGVNYVNFRNTAGIIGGSSHS
jgi:predicted AAA+ superfamily ATPase